MCPARALKIYLECTKPLHISESCHFRLCCAVYLHPSVGGKHGLKAFFLRLQWVPIRLKPFLLGDMSDYHFWLAVSSSRGEAANTYDLISLRYNNLRTSPSPTTISVLMLQFTLLRHQFRIQSNHYIFIQT